MYLWNTLKNILSPPPRVTLDLVTPPRTPPPGGGSRGPGTPWRPRGDPWHAVKSSIYGRNPSFWPPIFQNFRGPGTPQKPPKSGIYGRNLEFYPIFGGSKNRSFFIIKKNDEILIKILIKKSSFFRILKKVAFFRVFTEQTLRFYPFFWTRTPKNPKFSRVTFWGSNSSENHQNRCVFPECARVCFSCFFRTFNFC